MTRGIKVLAVLAVGAAIGALATPHRIADSSNYVLMADSLLHDGDLRYEPQDLERARALHFGDLPSGLMLVKRSDGAYQYGKPFYYPLTATPFYALLGVRGFLALNGLLLAALVLLGAELLAAKIGWRNGAIAAAAVYGFSVVPAYLHWIDPFLLLTTLVAVALVAQQRGWPALGGLALGAVASYRFPYAVIALIPLVLLVLSRNWRGALRFAAGAAIAALAVATVARLTAGEWSPYLGDRYYYNRAVPFELPANGEIGESFSRSETVTDWHPPALADVGRGLVDFVVGRAAGIVLYFPTFFACLLWARRWDREKLLWLAGVFGFALALEVGIPHHRVGGAHAIGNRFFVLMPIALCFIDAIDWRSWRMAVSGLLALLAVPIQHAPLYYSLHPGRQLLAWPHRLFPFEWPLAAHVAYPRQFPGLLALTENQYYWEKSPGAVWTKGGTTADFVLVRAADQQPRVKLWSLLPSARVGDGGEIESVNFGGSEREVTLTRPMAVFRDEYHSGEQVAVYWLRIDTDAWVVPSEAGTSDDRRTLGVFVQPMR